MQWGRGRRGGERGVGVGVVGVLWDWAMRDVSLWRLGVLLSMWGRRVCCGVAGVACVRQTG